MAAPVAPARRLALATLVGLALASAPAARAQWAYYDADREYSLDGRSSLALDAAGQPILAYTGIYLQVARWDGSTWRPEVVTTRPCGTSHPSLAIDRSGNPAVAYYDPDAGDLDYASWDGAAWTFLRVAHVGTWERIALRRSSLALDVADLPVIAYHDADDEDLELARFDGTVWRVETVDAARGAGTGVSLRLDTLGNPLVSYVDPTRGALRLARWDGAAWSLEVVDGSSSPWTGTALALDPAGNPAVSYMGGDAALRLARWTGTGWTIQTVDRSIGSNGRDSALAFDPAGNPVIAYVAETASHPYNHLKLARWNGIAWVIEELDRSDYLQHVGLGLDSAGRAVVSYDAYGLRATRWDGATWTLDLVDNGYRSPGDFSSLALDAAGQPRLSYTERHLQGSDLRYASYTGTGWARETVAPGGCQTSTSLVLDPTGNPRIAYADCALRYARWDGSTWLVETVDPTGADDVALVLDAAGNPSLAYTVAQEVRYARWDGSSWVVETVDTLDERWWKVSLARDPAGNPSLVYPGSRRESLRYAHRDGTAWTIETVTGLAAVSSIETWVSLAFDGAGNPAVAFSEASDVKLARFDGAAWTVETVAEAAVPGPVSLAFDLAGAPSLCYRFQGSPPVGDVVYARWDGTLWTSMRVDAFAGDGQTSGCTLRIDPAGTPWIGYARSSLQCGSLLRVAHLAPRAAVLYRGVVADTSPGWRAGSLPLTAANDDETPPFPLATEEPASADDALGATAPLVLYRVLIDGTTDAGNVLVAVKRPGRVHLHY